MTTTNNTTGKVSITYTATTTGSIDLALQTWSTSNSADFVLDNMTFAEVTTGNTMNLVGPTLEPDTLSYVGGPLDALASDDVITVVGTDLQAKLAAGGIINGGTGVDTLKLAANTTLNLMQLTTIQTVKQIEQIEIFQLQGGSTLTLSANDVLSLGGSNATTMSAYSFVSSTGGASSTGKVQFVVNATSTDTVNLDKLLGDAVITAGAEGNTGLGGSWSDMGNTVVNGLTYKVYNHSTTEAQVLVANGTVNTTIATVTTIVSASGNVPQADSFSSGFQNTATTMSTALWDVTDPRGVRVSADNIGYTGNWVLPTGHLQLGVNQANVSQYYTSTFVPKGGVTFNSISYVTAYGDVAQNQPIYVKFYDANNAMIASTSYSLPGVTTVHNTYNFSYSFSGAATRFEISMDGQNGFAIDNLGYTATTATTNITAGVASGGTVVDTTPDLNGTISRPLAVGETVEIFRDGSTTAVGTATINVGSTTWKWTEPTALSAAAHTYTAKLKSGGAYVSTSSAFSLTVATTPLVLDLNGDGVQTISMDQGVKFDLLNTGTKQSVGWVDKHDGLLVMDLNGDGQINSGAELFGDHTKLADGSLAKDGWAALAVQDTNADGSIDAKDAAFNALRVWIDANGDAITDAGELHTLKDLGITAIGLNTTAQQVAQNGNILGDKGKFTTVDGQSHDVVDAWFKVDTAAAQTAMVAKSASVSATVAATADAVQAATPVVDAITSAVTAAAVADQLVDVTLNELAPTGLEPLVFQHVLPINCEPSVMVPAAPVDAALPTDTTAVVDQQQPTHCDEPWLIELNGPTGTEPMVFKLNPESWNKPFALSAEQMSELNLPVPADNNLPGQFKLNVSDVLLNAADAYAKPALQLNGQELTADTLNLSTLLSPAAAPAHLTGTAQIEGQTFNFAANVSLQVLIDQQQHHAAVS